MAFQAYRFLTRLNADRGLIALGNGCIAQQNLKGLAVSDLNVTFEWREGGATTSGDLVLIGTWHEISTQLAGAGAMKLESHLDARSTGKGVDVNSEFDDMYGPMPGDAKHGKSLTKMTFYITAVTGATWQRTTDEARVVADPRKAIVQFVVGHSATFVAGSVAGVAQGTGELSHFAESLLTATDVAGLGMEPVKSLHERFRKAEKKQLRKEMGFEKRWNRTDITLTFGVTSVKKDSRGIFLVQRDTGKTVLKSKDIRKAALNALNELYTGLKASELS